MNPRALLLSSLLVALVASCASSPSKKSSPPPSSGAPASTTCNKAYKPVVCMAGKVRCVTDDDGCESCTCDDQPMPAPGQ